MRKHIMMWLSLTIAIMFLLPLLTVLFAGSSGMAICLLLFFVLNPIYSVAIGCVAGQCMKKSWWLPVISALVFLVSSWILYDMGESAFVMYAGIYLVLGVLAMLMVANWRRSSGNRSKQAAEKLPAQGYTNIVEIGGIIDWPGETVRE